MPRASRIAGFCFAPALCLVAAVLLACSAPARAGDSSDFFEQRVRPVLIDKCYGCHSADAKKLKGDLRLDTKEGVLKGGENGPVLVAGDPDHSRLIEAIRWTNPDLKMPPKVRLSDQQIADLTAWVKAGAPDPRTGPAVASAAPYDYAAARKQWAFHAPEPHPVPEVRRAEWCRSPIDRFILARLEEKGLSPAPQADKRTLLRRATFDLTGLPPTPEEIDAFLKDDSPDAFAKVVDRLLASPRYGERWARHWLDVVRYTDSFDSRGVGSAGDCANAWRYRDWVVKSLNGDLPYDQFVMQQVAGDLLPARDGAAFNADGLIATSMYVFGNWPGGDADRKKMLTDIVDDQVDVTGRAFLGLTLACARCHDHKFDPIPASDYYGLAGIFFSSHFIPDPGSSTSGGPLLRFPLASPAELEQRKQYDAKIATLQKEIDGARDAAIVARARALLPETDKYLIAAWQFRDVPESTSKASSLSAFAAERGLDALVLGRWVEYLAPYTKPAALKRTLLATPRHNVRGIVGVDAWTGPSDQPPNAIANATDKPVPLGTLTLPPRSVSVHPGQRSGAAVGWTSVVTGPVSISGRVLDADGVCGNGINWAIDRVSADGVPHRLAAGTIANGGAQAFSEGLGGGTLRSVDVRPGEILQVVVYPKGEYSCDTTVVELDVHEEQGAKRAWNLARDVLPDVLVDGRGNPHADALGNAGVWQFYEVADEAPGGTLPADSSLVRWIASAASEDAEHAGHAAEAVREALAALDVQAEGLRAAGKDLASLTGADAKVYRDLIAPAGPFWLPLRSKDEASAPVAREQLASMREALKSLQKSAPPAPAMCEAITEGGVPQSMYAGIHDARIHIRGRYDRLGDTVPRHFPVVLAGDEQPLITQGSGRVDLARWLASEKNPQTARVMVNRLWQHHFGEGIVRTPNNYGKLGRPPTHPELLDRLALEFVRQGWSIKAMHRAMMLSAAYQQSSIPDGGTQKADPDDELFGWHRRERLEAEAIRDSLLAAAGVLDGSMGGLATRDLNSARRTLYLMTIRSDRSDYRTLFDAADPTAIVDARIDSTVAPQALFLMNNPFVTAQAKRIAARVVKEGSADERGRIEWIYKRLYGRDPTDAEVAVGSELMHGSHLAPDEAWAAYCEVLVCANEFVYVD